MNADDLKMELERIAARVGDAGNNESLVLRSNVHIELRGPDGELKEVRDEHNLTCTAGKEVLLSVASGKQVKDFAYMAIGNGTTAAAITDTYATMVTPTYYATNPVTPTNPDADHTQFQATWAAGSGTGAVTEAALLDAGATGHMLFHQIFAAVNKGASDTLQITWSIS
jgi:hypothetical protein